MPLEMNNNNNHLLLLIPPPFFFRVHKKNCQAERRACKTDYALGISQQLDMVLHLLNNGQMVLHFRIL